VIRTIRPNTFVVQSAYPDPPFDMMSNGAKTGFDVELMRAVCRELGLAFEPVAYTGSDFNGIFDALGGAHAAGTCDAVISGTTITPSRSAEVLFSQPYLEFNQGVAVNRERSPHAATTADLRGLTAGIQSGNTSDAVAKRLLAAGEIAGIRYYPYDGIANALDDLASGRIGLVIKLFPVITWLVKDRPQLKVVMQVPTHEKLGVAYAEGREDLRDAVDQAIAKLRASGEFATLHSRWFGGSA
jgi:polar amino acid transport system substrate-binding protein